MHILENVYVWNFFRKFLDIFFGVYKIVEKEIREFGIGRSQSMLDIGCGSGQHSQLSDADYLGLDMDRRYIDYARKKYGSERRKFECVKLQDANLNGQRFDVSLLVNLLHHISTEDARDLLESLSKITNQYLVSFDPIIQSPRNDIGRFLTDHDRGKFIRNRQQHLDLISEYFEIITVKDLKNFLLKEWPC